MDIYDSEDKLILELVNQGNDLLIVIRCHLLLESYLIKIIESILPNPSELEIDKLSFIQKVGLALAINGISHEMKGLLIKLNSIRNKFAHDHLKTITDKEIIELENTMSIEQRKELMPEELYRCECATEKLGGLFLLAISYLQVCANET